MDETSLISWLKGFTIDQAQTNKEVIICPPFTLLPDLKSQLLSKSKDVELGAQDISQFDEGAYTGEVNGKEIRELARFVIVGHSERRKNFSENNEVVNAKITQAFKNALIPIICVSNMEQVGALNEVIKDSAQFIIAYEPLFAIGSGNPDTPENADKTAENIKNILGKIPVLYGGSVTSKNIGEFCKMPNIDGALIGKASLDPKEFSEIIKNA